MTRKLDESTLVKMISLQQFGNPDDVSELTYFLVEKNSKYITGQIITVDGGLSI
ncbi:SDR family oxidoreductase [Viridibacillus arvi]|uniref:SDR family oxidoreductase n=1 Tax=Viridibacillus arvi TaxID=263475 RepID=UPI003D05D992